MEFNYQARTKQGEIYSGSIQASSKDAAVSVLRERGLFPTFLEELTVPIYRKKIKFLERITKKDIIVFSRQLSIMFKSNVSLIEALRVLALETNNPDFKDYLFKISEDVEAGTAFSQALARYPHIFPFFYISVLKSGEASGKLSESLEYLADHLEREYHLIAKIRSAMIYPALVIFVIILVLLILLFFVLPNLIQVFEMSEQELPLATQIVINTTEWFNNWWLLFSFGVVSFIIICVYYWRTDEGRRFFDRLFIKFPIVGNFLKLVYLTRFAENLSTLITSGLPIIQALEIVKDILGNIHYKDAILMAKEKVSKGEMISSALSQSPELFSAVFVQMVSVGEKTGRLSAVLMNVVDFYQKEIDRTIENILSILEPVLIVFLGVVVGGIMFSVLLPLYQLAAF